MTRTPAAAATAPDSPPRPARPKWRYVLAFWRIMTIVTVSLLFLGCFLLRRLPVRQRRRRIALAVAWTQSWARACCFLAGYHIRVFGAAPPRGVMIAPNHISYGDIFVLAASAPCFFLAKAEVAQWPVFGWLASNSDHLFATRRRTRQMQDTSTLIVDRLAMGESVCVFLEGTSSGGDRVLPFRSSFVQPAIDQGVPVVPVAIHWRSDDPWADVAEDIAYWKDHTMKTHMFRHLSLRHIAVDVHFCEPIAPVGLDRKTLSNRVRRTIQSTLGLPETH